MASKVFIELDSLLFALCTECEYDMNCPHDVKENCPIMKAVNIANYIEIDESMLGMEN